MAFCAADEQGIGPRRPVPWRRPPWLFEFPRCQKQRRRTSCHISVCRPTLANRTAGAVQLYFGSNPQEPASRLSHCINVGCSPSLALVFPSWASPYCLGMLRQLLRRAHLGRMQGTWHCCIPSPSMAPMDDVRDTLRACICLRCSKDDASDIFSQSIVDS